MIGQSVGHLPSPREILKTLSQTCLYNQNKYFLVVFNDVLCGGNVCTCVQHPRRGQKRVVGSDLSGAGVKSSYELPKVDAGK